MLSEYKQGWALKSAQESRQLNKIAKSHAEEYFYSQRSLVPPRRAEGAFMRNTLEEAKDPNDPTGRKYLFEYEIIPTEKQLQSLFSRLEKTRTSGCAKAAKVPRTVKGVRKSAKSAQSKASVRSAKGGSRKRNVVVESEESEGSIELEEEDEEEMEFEQEHEEDFINRVIQEEIGDLFL